MTAKADGMDGWIVFIENVDFVTCMKNRVE
jgi:hypothetical protein